MKKTVFTPEEYATLYSENIAKDSKTNLFSAGQLEAAFLAGFNIHSEKFESMRDSLQKIKDEAKKSLGEK